MIRLEDALSLTVSISRLTQLLESFPSLSLGLAGRAIGRMTISNLMSDLPWICPDGYSQPRKSGMVDAP